MVSLDFRVRLTPELASARRKVPRINNATSRVNTELDFINTLIGGYMTKTNERVPLWLFILRCSLLVAAFILVSIFSPYLKADETCVTSTFAGVTTTRCKEDGQVTSVCKSREFGGKIYTECK